jgi:hypothetical protein
MRNTLLFGVLLCFSSFSAALPTNVGPPRETIGGVSVIQTPIVRDALAYARANSDDLTYSHVVRSWLFGALIIEKNTTLSKEVDLEVHALATILHDLGWDERPDSPLISNDKRFEVDGASAARNFILGHSEGKTWSKSKVQLVWDSIALHTQQSIWLYKEPDVAVVAQGIYSDIFGPTLGITQVQYDNVWKTFPGEKAAKTVEDKIVSLCRRKPVSTYGE